MLTVCCLNWRDYQGRGQAYVSRLQDGVKRHLSVPHEFVEVTERDIPEGRSGWFNKLHLLEMFDGDVMYLDLDVGVTANIDRLVEIFETDKSRIWARDDWSYPVTNPRIGLEATINSSVMLWSGKKDMSRLTERMIRETHGDQGIITQLFWPHGIGLLPGELVKSYKYDVLRNGGAAEPICVFHGQPKPHEVGAPWW
jgi:hypothetical protein